MRFQDFGNYPRRLRLGLLGQRRKKPVLGCVCCICTGSDEYDGEWGVSITYDPGLNVCRRLFHEPDRQSFDRLRTQVSQALGGRTGNKAGCQLPPAVE
jgi:hypothetical protein